MQYGAWQIDWSNFASLYNSISPWDGQMLIFFSLQSCWKVHQAPQESTQKSRAQGALRAKMRVSTSVQTCLKVHQPPASVNSEGYSTFKSSEDKYQQETPQPPVREHD
jgi:hypothetical protein